MQTLIFPENNLNAIKTEAKYPNTQFLNNFKVKTQKRLELPLPPGQLEMRQAIMSYNQCV